MAIASYFFDSVGGDRVYSARDFARAFDIFLNNGVLPEEANGKLGFELGGTNYTTVYAGRAVINGHLIEVTGTETLTVPSGTINAQLVIQLDVEDARNAALVIKTNRTPTQTSNFYEMPLYNLDINNGVITKTHDMRVQGGISQHTHVVDSIEGLTALLNAKADDSNTITWSADPNGIRANMGKFAGTGKPIILYLTTGRPSPSSSEHRVWIQIDNF